MWHVFANNTYFKSFVDFAWGVEAAVSGFLFDLDPGPPLARFGVDCCAGSEASRLFEVGVTTDASGDNVGSAATMLAFGDAESDGDLFEAAFKRSLIFRDGVPAIFNVHS